MRVPETPPATSDSGGVLVLANDLISDHRCQSSRDFLRMSLSSFGPLISLRLRTWRSSSVADGSLIRSISWAAISDAFAALFGADSLRRVVSSPSSSSRRIASGRAGLSLCLAAQASTLSRSSDERRMVATASCPVVRRPFFVRAAICFLFFSPHHLPTQRRSSIPAKEGGGDPSNLEASAPWAVRARCADATAYTLDGSESV